MSDIQQAEIAKLHSQITQDVHKLVDKYLRIMEWEVPETDEAAARAMILEQIKVTLETL
ncbi:hypothetical protein [Aliamphritea spongicola]|uniref:hypothetical protein n=1 Tax=Aliamphritea spongicola TaxID=707589 RepID=UPI00196AD883|nr:hypothetical protein [Aliamphritea spongicola]MBN3561611.1 hypothetical protein [Aliamphritea spongicola]